MSRFSDDYEDPGYANAGELWWANVERAIQGKRGQKALRELFGALETMPEKRLVEGHLVKEGDVCAVGAYVVHRRVTAGTSREQVLHELAMEHARCQCWHGMNSHGEDGRGPCGVCAHSVAEAERSAAAGSPYRWTPKTCDAFRWSEDFDSDEDAWETADIGRQAGMTTALAWRLALLNDEDLAERTPEERYTAVVAWIRSRLVQEAVPA